MDDRGLRILNGNTKGDKNGEFTFIGKQGVSTIDYVLVNNEGWEEVRKFTVEEKTDSDLTPLKVEIGEKAY